MRQPIVTRAFYDLLILARAKIGTTLSRPMAEETLELARVEVRPTSKVGAVFNRTNEIHDLLFAVRGFCDFGRDFAA